MNEAPPPPDNGFYGKRNIVALLAGSGIFALGYWLVTLIDHGKGGTSSIIFLGLPTLSTILVASLAPTRKMIFKSCYISLLFNLILSPFLYAEGVFCVIMAAPIFAAMTAVTALFVWLARSELPEPKPPSKPPMNPPAKLMLLLIFGILGGSVWDEITLQNGAPIETVTSEIEISASRGKVWDRLTFDRAPISEIPTWLKLWVKNPDHFAFGTTGLGARRETDFGSPRYGDDHDAIRNKLVYEITEWTQPAACTFACKENHSRMRNWIDLLDTRVELHDAGTQNVTGSTRVTLTTRYRRRVGPSIYFTPFLNAAVRGMHEMLEHELETAEK